MWIQTKNGNVFELGAFSEIVNVDDIASPLNNIQRFNGHTKAPYSVAMHCINVERLYGQRYQITPMQRLAALLHDAHEAFIGDMTTPIKTYLASRISAFTEHWDKLVWHVDMTIASHFLLDKEMRKELVVAMRDPALRECDRDVTIVEANELLEPCDRQWPNVPLALPNCVLDQGAPDNLWLSLVVEIVKQINDEFGQ